jgi:hypothetical protein
MPKTPVEKPPGSDFFASLQQLFDEAETKGINAGKKNEWQALKYSVVQFLSVCKQTTGAKARATNSVKFLDGSEPRTTLALPPCDLGFPDKLKNQLVKKSSGREFVGHLLAAYNSQRNPPTRKRKAPQVKRELSTEATINETTVIQAPAVEAKPRAKKLKLTVRFSSKTQTCTGC